MEQTLNSASWVNKKKNKYFHYEKLEHWKNECRKCIIEEKITSENGGSRDDSLRQEDIAIYTTDMIYVVNMAVAKKLFMPDNESMWYMNCEVNKHILSHKNAFIDYHSIINNSKNIIDIDISILKITERENVKLSNKYDNFAIMQNILHIS